MASSRTPPGPRVGEHDLVPLSTSAAREESFAMTRALVVLPQTGRCVYAKHNQRSSRLEDIPLRGRDAAEPDGATGEIRPARSTARLSPHSVRFAEQIERIRGIRRERVHVRCSRPAPRRRGRRARLPRVLGVDPDRRGAAAATRTAASPDAHPALSSRRGADAAAPFSAIRSVRGCAEPARGNSEARAAAMDTVLRPRVLDERTPRSSAGGTDRRDLSAWLERKPQRSWSRRGGSGSGRSRRRAMK